MKKTHILATLFLLIGISTSWGQKKDFVGEYVYTAGDRDSKDVCYDIAKTRLRAKLLDQIGVYVKSESMINTTEANGKYNQSFIENITTTNAGVTKFNVIDQKWDGVKYWMKAVLTVDTTSLRQLVINKQKEDEIENLKQSMSSMKAELELVTGKKTSSIKNTKNNFLYTKQVLSAGDGEQFISLKLSLKNDLLFLTTTKGKMIVLNKDDSVLKTVRFKTLGKVFLDNDGIVGAYSDENHVVYFFDQKTLNILDTVTVSKTKGYGAYSVWFTKTGRIFISSPKNVYRYEIDKSIHIVGPSYSILDYAQATDRFLLGYWDDAMISDRKIKKLYTCDATNIDVKKQVLTIDRSFELYSYFMDNGGMIVSYDGKGNYYTFNTFSWQKNTLIQDNITDIKKKTYGLSKIDENIIMIVKQYSIDLTDQNIAKYEIKFGDTPTEFVFKKLKGDEMVRSIVLLQPVYANNILINTNTKTTYYISTGWNNKLISIK